MSGNKPNIYIIEDDETGVPYFAGTQVSIREVLSALSEGVAFDVLQESYPFLTEELISIAEAYVDQPE